MAAAHVPSEVLAGYADGSLTCGMSLLVASHLTYCPACRSKVSCLEALGGALLAEAKPVPPGSACLEKVLSRLDGERTAAEPPAPSTAAHLPCPLHRRLGADLDGLRWRTVLPGLAVHRLNGFKDEDVMLVRARPGTRVPAHTHSGREATLVLAGQLRDGDRVLSRGDMSVADESVDHRPEAVGDEACVCLMALDGRMVFTGPIGRFVGPYIGRFVD